MSSEQYSNVWDALFDDKAEIASSKIKTELMHKIRSYIKQNNITQKVAAEIMEVSQPRISDVVRGKISQFTIDALVEMLARADVEISLTFSTVKIYPWVNYRVVGGGKKKFQSQAEWQSEIEGSNTNKNLVSCECNNNEYAISA